MTAHWADTYKSEAYEGWYVNAKQYDTLTDWWANCQAPYDMLWLLVHEGYRNEQVLHAIALDCVRHSKAVVASQWSEDDLGLAEKYLEGGITFEDLEEAWTMAWGPAWAMECERGLGEASVVAQAVIWAIEDAIGDDRELAIERGAEADIIRGLISAKSVETLSKQREEGIEVA